MPSRIPRSSAKSVRAKRLSAFAGFPLRPLAVLAALCAVVPIASGTGTDPALALTGVSVEVGATACVVRLEGDFLEDDLVQLAYPLQILIRETALGASYVRYDTSLGAFTDVAPELLDGLAPEEALALLGKGSPSPDATIVFLGSGRIELLLPASFPAGGAEVQLFVVDTGQVILSNPLPFSVSGAGS